MKTKTADLTGPALDWAVAKCEGMEMEGYYGPFEGGWNLSEYSFTTDWAQGGPIIERERVLVARNNGGLWVASMQPYEDASKPMRFCFADTPLVAAMRAYVASKLGDEVDVPEELT